MKDEERPPLRVVLRNFLNHIENLESQISPDKNYDIEFQALKLFSESVKGLKEYSCLEGEKEVNRKKNRYKDILPFDVSRVVLQEYNGIPGSDYINANFIKGASGSPAYIASQGPLPCTVNDFWRMVVQCEVHVIVMACNQEEAGKAKCEKYWVDEGEERHFGRISVRLLKSSTVCPDFSVRTMRLKYSNTTSMVAEERTVCQVHYVAWPDHGVPSVVHPLLDMVRLVRDTQASETLPVLIHCSAGCGRTGTICAIDYVFGLLRNGKLTSDFSLSSLIRDMRRQRIAMVQTKEQYVLVHQAVRELFREQLSVIDSHPYENVDPDGCHLLKTDHHNIYDTIDCTQEKGDLKMEKDFGGTCNSKRKGVTLYSSKQEKEVENLTEQLRSFQGGHKEKPCLNVYGSNMYSNPVAKHKYNQSDHHVATNKSTIRQRLVYKKENNLANKPIPAKGILRVPLLTTSTGNTTTTTSYLPAVLPVKRSKSLKILPARREVVLGNASLTVHPETKTKVTKSVTHHSQPSTSSHNNIKQYTSVDLTCGEGDESFIPVTPKKEQRPLKDEHKNYAIISGKKPLVRSYTTLDMRHKLAHSHNTHQYRTRQIPLTRIGIDLMKPDYPEPSGSASNVIRNYRCKTDDFHNARIPPSCMFFPRRSSLENERNNANDVSAQSTSCIVQQQPIRNHFFSPHKGFHEKKAIFYEKSKISFPSKETKDLEKQQCENSTNHPDKCRCVKTKLSRHKTVDTTSSISCNPIFSGTNVPMCLPPLPPRNQFQIGNSASENVNLNYINFVNAPGVDIDQVAASIPHEDGCKSNLMKVALEAFQAKMVKPQSRANENHTVTGIKYHKKEKRQQQYL